jgi:hypothetical protein
MNFLPLYLPLPKIRLHIMHQHSSSSPWCMTSMNSFLLVPIKYQPYTFQIRLAAKQFQVIVYMQHKNITWHATNQSSGYDVYRWHAVLHIVVAMMSIDSNYSVIDIMSIRNRNYYVVLARCSSYFIAWKGVCDCLIAVLCLSSFN